MNRSFTFLLIALLLAPALAWAQNETGYPPPGGDEFTAQVGGFTIPFVAVLPFVALLGWALTEYMPGIEGKAKPMFVAALAAVIAVLAEGVFGIGYDRAVALAGAALTSSFANSMIRAVPGGENLKKRPKA